MKRAYYALTGPLMLANGLLYRHVRAPKSGYVRVHLGPGREKYVDNWVNVDSNIVTGKTDIWADLRNPLPFHNNTVDAMYSHHVVEHLPDLNHHFREVYRCLKPGAVYRIGGPNGDSAIQKFLEDDKEWFSDRPDKRTSIGGRFENMIFCRREHLTILTWSYLEELLLGVGFSNVSKKLPIKETGHENLFSDIMKTEHEQHFDCPKTLIVEAVK